MGFTLAVERNREFTQDTKMMEIVVGGKIPNHIDVILEESPVGPSAAFVCKISPQFPTFDDPPDFVFYPQAEYQRYGLPSKPVFFPSAKFTNSEALSKNGRRCSTKTSCPAPEIPWPEGNDCKPAWQ